MRLSDELPAQFWFNMLIINKVILVYFLDYFLTVLFYIGLIWSVLFLSLKFPISIDHSYQSNGGSILCNWHHFGVQNWPLQAEILIQMYELLTRLFYRIKHNDHNGIQELTCTNFINLESEIDHVRGWSKRKEVVAATATILVG